METFAWPNHTVSTDYPVNGFKMQFGNSYEYAEGSPAPDQRTFTLSFPLMKYLLDPEGVIDATIQADINMQAMDDFYNVHKTWKAFIYPHPVYGNVNVRFSKPLKIPAGIPGGDGAVGAFSLELVEQP